MANIKIAKKKRKKQRRPDRVYNLGSLQFAQFGRLTVAKNFAPPEHFEELRRRTPEYIAELEGKIRISIDELVDLLRELDPVSFLTNAYIEYFSAHVGIEDEPSVTEEHSLKHRMLDYCASLFAALPENPSARSHTAEEFERAKACIKKLFSATKMHVFWARSLEYDDDDKQRAAAASLTTKLILHWIFVRSDRHSYFEIPHYRSALAPFDAVIQRSLRVSAADIISGLEKIISNAQSGYADAALLMQRAHEASTAHPDFLQVLTLPDEERLAAIGRLAGLEDGTLEAAVESFFGSRLFDMQSTTGWPAELIDRLSYRLGEADGFLSTGSLAGWPSRIWPIFTRPFLKVGQTSFCFDYISFFDRFYRQLLRILRELNPGEEINHLQSRATENAAAELFERILPGARVLRNVYYKIDGKWCESDLCVLFKDVIIAVEVRSGTLTPTSPDACLLFPIYRVPNIEAIRSSLASVGGSRYRKC